MNNCQPNCGCKFEVDSSCVRYTAVNLGTSLINVGDTIETTIIKIDQAITNLQQTINNNQPQQFSGPLNKVVKFGPPSNPLLPSQTEDDGDSIGINASPNASTKVLIETSQNQSGLKVSSLNNGKEAIIAENQAQGSIINKSLVSFASGSTTSNIGIETSSTGTSVTNIGLSSTAIGATNNYSVQLKDGTQTVNGGKFLKDKGDGKANWNYIYLSDIQDYQPYSLPIASSTVLGGIKIGSGLSIDGQGVLSANTSGFISAVNGTNNYVAKFTPNGTTIGNSKIVDNGTNVYIDDANINAYASSKFYVSTNNTEYIFRGAMSNTSAQTARGIEINVSIPNNSKSDIITAGHFSSSGSTLRNIGVYGEATSPTNGKNIGGYFAASNSQIASYAIQLFDSSRGAGKYLKCITNDGEANWANITASDVQGAVGAVNGTNNYVAKFTPNGTTIGNSQIQDDGTSITIGTTTYADSKISITDSIKTKIFNIIQSKGNGSNTSVNIQSIGSGATLNTGIQGSGANATTNIGILGIADNGTTCIGLKATASNGTNKYSAQLQDGTEAVGKFLKSVTSDGKANWANITASDVQGAVGAVNGTNNYVAKFTPDGNTIGNSLIQDNGTNISINSTPLTGIQFYISSTLTSGINVTLTGSNALNIGNGSYVSGGGTTNIGYNTQSYGATGANIGGRFRTGVAGDANLPNGHDIAVYGSSEGSSRGNIGGLFVATGGTSNYAVQLQDGTQGQGKFLKSITADGKANWANITAADIQGLSGGSGGISGIGSLNRFGVWNGTSSMTYTGLGYDPTHEGIWLITSNSDRGLEISGDNGVLLSGLNNYTGSSLTPGFLYRLYTDSGLVYPSVRIGKIIGTHSNPQPNPVDSILGSFDVSGARTINNMIGSDASISVIATENHTISSWGNKMVFSITKNGQNTKSTSLVLDTSGAQIYGNISLVNATTPTTQSVTQTKYLPITINGVTYKLLLAD